MLRSVKNLGNLRWNRDSIETNLKRYIKSVDCLEEMQAAFPERVCVSVLDHLDPEKPNSAFFERVFAFGAPTSTTRSVPKSTPWARITPWTQLIRSPGIRTTRPSN